MAAQDLILVEVDGKFQFVVDRIQIKKQVIVWGFQVQVNKEDLESTSDMHCNTIQSLF